MAATSESESEKKAKIKEMRKELNEIAKRGDIQSLHELIEKEREILKYDETPADTALHIAAHHGKAIFAAEVAILNPDLAKKLNHNGHTPLHIALKSKHWKTAAALTALDVELIRLKGSGGKTALHVAAEIAPARLLAEFLCICPSSLEDITSRKETAVHRALKKKNFHNFEVLYKWMFIERKEYLLQWKDFKGNTALHVAVAKWNDFKGAACEDVRNWKKVLKIVAPYVPRETTNFKGKTAAQLLSPQTTKSADDKEVRRLLTRYNFKYEVDNYLKRHFLKTKILDNLEMNSWFEKRLRFLGFPDVRTPAGEKSRDVVLLVATLIATATYQAILTPPGGYWQEDYPAPTPRLDLKAAPASHSAGQMIMSGMTLTSFTATNAVAFCFALAAIVLNVAQLKQATLMMVAAYVLLFNYMSTILLSTMMGKDKNWGYFKPKTWKFYPESALPLFLTVTGIFYGFMGFYVALHNKYGTVMDSSARGSIPVLDEKDSDEKDSDDEKSDDEEHVELLSMKVVV